ncbi:hypothetical protein, partial [Burkholderia pseudomallei]
LSSNPVPEVPCDRAIPPPDIHKIRRQVTQSFSKAPRFSAMNQILGVVGCVVGGVFAVKDSYEMRERHPVFAIAMLTL